MNIFLDTNILLDVLIEGRIHRDASLKIVNAAKHNPDLTAFVSVQSMTDIAFVFTNKKKTDKQKFHAPLKEMLSFLTLTTISTRASGESLNGDFPDFEDEEQLRCALEENCSYFITSDRQILDTNPFDIKAVHPRDFLAMASKTGHRQ